MYRLLLLSAAVCLSTSLLAAERPDAAEVRFPSVAKNQRRETTKRVPKVAVQCAYDENGDPIPCNDDWGTEPFSGADQEKYNSLCTPQSRGTRYLDMTCRTPTTGIISQYCAAMQGRICEIFQRDNTLAACKTCAQ